MLYLSLPASLEPEVVTVVAGNPVGVTATMGTERQCTEAGFTAIVKLDVDKMDVFNGRTRSRTAAYGTSIGRGMAYVSCESSFTNAA